ncbi:FAD-dependent monooxygenase [Streptomyces sp. Lzd4kr]|nr:FAD-dependent monooxygenase [Streptomyces sp. Lzd4kr]
MAHVMIAGGGIGGLAAAVGLAHQGHRITVLERRDAFTELGAGIQLAPNAFHALDQLGIGDAVRARAVFIDELRLMDGTNDEPIQVLPLTDSYRKRFGNPYTVLHRHDLYQPLLDACRALNSQIRLCVDATVESYLQSDGQVTALLASRDRITADALVGADGIQSAVRRALVGDGGPRVSGHTIYRALVPMKVVPSDLRTNAVTLWAGPRWHVVHYPISSGRVLNLAAVRDDGAAEAVAGASVGDQEVLHAFPTMSKTPARLLRLGQDWKKWVLCDRDPVCTWVDGRVALLGDAAHPMLQYAAQGACMALEDAALLGSLFDIDAEGIPDRFAAYNARRRDRTAKAQWLARHMGTHVYHPAGAQAEDRTAMLSALSVAELYDKVTWLHGARDFTRT